MLNLPGPSPPLFAFSLHLNERDADSCGSFCFPGASSLVWLASRPNSGARRAARRCLLCLTEHNPLLFSMSYYRGDNIVIGPFQTGNPMHTVFSKFWNSTIKKLPMKTLPIKYTDRIANNCVTSVVHLSQSKMKWCLRDDLDPTPT